MTVGATAGKEPDFIQNQDLMSLDDMRSAMKEMREARLSLAQQGSVAGVMTELDVTRQKMENMHEQMQKLIGLYTTLQSEFTQYKQQRVAELQVKVNGGATSREDEEIEWQ